MRARRRGRDHSTGRRRLMRSRARRREPIDAAALLARGRAAPRTARSLLFLGTVREVNDGRAGDGHRVHAPTRRWRSASCAAIAREAAERFGGGARRRSSIALGDARARRGERRDRRGACAPRRRRIDASRYVIEELKQRVPDLEARALRRRHARVGGPDRHGRPRAASRRHERARLDQFGRTHRVPAHLGHRPLQLPLPVLHAAGGAAVAAARRTS